uniref:ATP synthase complex subunit 8 n=1 Tax=Thrichomys apereoides TaxID=43327 RepID=A0A1S5S6Z7_THRAP|nr:ATP synthase F0 subunit 8 [Thrichomys apereoides]
MPQLDTSTWTLTITFTMLTLFIVFQLKTVTHEFPYNPQPTSSKLTKQNTPWEEKWTKIYSPLL